MPRREDDDDDRRIVSELVLAYDLERRFQVGD